MPEPLSQRITTKYYSKLGCFTYFTQTKTIPFTETIFHIKQDIIINGSFTLEKFVSKTAGNFAQWPYLPWPPWAARHK
jgi:hypothetical protein